MFLMFDQPGLKNYSPVLLFVGVRAKGGMGGNLGQLKFFGQQEKIWAKPVFKDVSMIFLLYLQDKYFLF